MSNSVRSRSSEFEIRARRAGSRRPFIRFESTPPHIVTPMLELAGVKARDVVYDLGSGDGRIAIAAAKRFGAQGVGIEIHAGRVAQATLNAQQAGVADRVRFMRQDLFEADLRPATVVTLFLLPEANVMLRPKMLRELAPGSRIVSYIHEMGGWKPEKARYTVDRFGWYDRLYLWTVPVGPPRYGTEAPAPERG
ncbi:MAG TPA: class I SAM-dependent methyltransferase [Steroidobacteraceae bacterium]|nr:class I SAM-dependent methyltransferase [Steroidobacteraceae bacterium]